MPGQLHIKFDAEGILERLIQRSSQNQLEMEGEETPQTDTLWKIHIAIENHHLQKVNHLFLENLQ